MNIKHYCLFFEKNTSYFTLRQLFSYFCMCFTNVTKNILNPIFRLIVGTYRVPCLISHVTPSDMTRDAFLITGVTFAKISPISPIELMWCHFLLVFIFTQGVFTFTITTVKKTIVTFINYHHNF